MHRVLRAQYYRGGNLKPQDHREWKRVKIPKMKECPINTLPYNLEIYKRNSLLKQAGLFSPCTALVTKLVRRQAEGPGVLCSAEAQVPSFKPW